MCYVHRSSRRVEDEIPDDEFAMRLHATRCDNECGVRQRLSRSRWKNNGRSVVAILPCVLNSVRSLYLIRA